MDATLLLVNPEEAVREQNLGKVCKTQPRGRVRTTTTGKGPGQAAVLRERL